jgi:pimeloyl-ACP methyl ester carboxylesterase
MADTIAQHNKNTIAIGLLRPGYTDPTGNTSAGAKGLTNGDNYTSEVLATISETIQKLKNHYHPAKTILVGHSGGSAISADIAGMYPGLVNAVVLVSCPCNLQAWRWHMFRKQTFNPVWLLPVGSISPAQVAGDITDSTRVILITGVDDDITPIAIPYQYYKQLKTLHKNARHIALTGKGHEILLEDTVVKTISGLLNQQ